MNTKTKRNFLSFLTTLMFLALVSVFCMPMMANAAAVHNAHSGHKNHTGWTAISNGEDLKTLLENGGSGYLTCDIKLNDFGLRTSSREIDLCLNGYKIIEVISEESMMYEYYYDIFTLENGSTFNLYDESGNSGELTHSSGLGGAFFVEDGSFNMNGGNITKNNSVFGSGVNVRKGTFTMNGGKISGNTSVHGGGVFINYDGTFVLNDGIISNNSNKEGGSGAGVSSDGKFTMNGGTISGNTSDSRGGGVCSAGKFIMNGGSISKNTGSLGGGVCTDGTFTMKAGKITNNTSTHEGGGVYANDMITITGGQIKGNKAKYGGTGVAIFSRGLITSGIVTDTILMDNGVHTVTYNPNQGTGDEITQYWSNTFVDKNIRANKFKRSGYSFYNWNTKADGSGTSYADKAKINFKKDITLYAQWAPSKYTVKFDSNGGSGTMASQTIAFNTSTALKTNSFKYSGYNFAGWNTKADGSGTSYTDGQKVKLIVLNTKTITLYAQWEKNKVSYKVEHYKQKLDGTYNKTANETETFKGKSNASVTPEVKSYKGFKSPAAKTVKIKADGSLVVKYYYTRNSYKLTWDFAGGSAKGSYTKGSVKYGAKITAPVPTRDGYEFTGWDKTVASKMPAKNVTYTATWRKLSKKEQVTKFVERFYTIILERPAEANGLTDWTNRLIGKTATGADVAAGFINSEEFQKKKMTDEEYVTKLYRAFFDREPDQDGYNGWLRELKNGKSRDDVLRGFINSPEFNNLCKKYGINTGSY